MGASFDLFPDWSNTMFLSKNEIHLILKTLFDEHKTNVLFIFHSKTCHKLLRSFDCMWKTREKKLFKRNAKNEMKNIVKIWLCGKLHKFPFIHNDDVPQTKYTRIWNIFLTHKMKQTKKIYPLCWSLSIIWKWNVTL